MQNKSRRLQGSAAIMAVAAVGVICVATWVEAEGPKQGRGPCAGDIEKHCRDVQLGGGRIAECLKAHENDLSEACRAHIDQMKKRSLEIQEACQDDSQRLCKDVQPGGGRHMKCLKEHEAELSAACREKLPKGRRAN